jgi:hypothetical protein
LKATPSLSLAGRGWVMSTNDEPLKIVFQINATANALGPPGRA